MPTSQRALSSAHTFLFFVRSPHSGFTISCRVSSHYLFIASLGSSPSKKLLCCLLTCSIAVIAAWHPTRHCLLPQSSIRRSRGSVRFAPAPPHDHCSLSTASDQSESYLRAPRTHTRSHLLLDFASSNSVTSLHNSVPKDGRRSPPIRRCRPGGGQLLRTTNGRRTETARQPQSSHGRCRLPRSLRHQDG